MKRALAICNTPLILINFINLSRQLPEKRISVILTDESVGMEACADRLRRMGLFENVYYVKIRKKYKGGNLAKKIRKTFYAYETGPHAVFHNVIQDWNFEELYFSLYDIAANQLFQIIRKHNPDIKCYRYEECHSDYIRENGYAILSIFMRLTGKLMHREILQNHVQGYYLYHPKWLPYESKIPLYEMPIITRSDEKTIGILNEVFGYKGQIEEFQDKIIFLEESFSVDKNDIDDFRLILDVADCVGKNNLIIKPHPRNDVSRFEKYGIQTSTTRIPWELVLLNGDLKNTVLITISSGSVVNALSWNISMHKSILLFKVLPRRPKICSPNYESFIEKSAGISSSPHVAIPEDYDEMKRELATLCAF